ncbi:Uncharacterised protein [Vibrio cholerae]|nr:Uncharacterised protein [Vibrio cholerae]
MKSTFSASVFSSASLGKVSMNSASFMHSSLVP